MLYSMRHNLELNRGARMINEVNRLMEIGDYQSRKKAERIKNRIRKIKIVDIESMVHRAETMRG